MVLLFHVVMPGLEIMNQELCSVSLCPVTVLTHVHQTAVSYPSRANITAVKCSDLNHKQTMIPSDLFTDILTNKLLTHTTIRYLNL